MTSRTAGWPTLGCGDRALKPGNDFFRTLDTFRMAAQTFGDLRVVRRHVADLVTIAWRLGCASSRSTSTSCSARSPEPGCSRARPSRGPSPHPECRIPKKATQSLSGCRHFCAHDQRERGAKLVRVAPAQKAARDRSAVEGRHLRARRPRVVRHDRVRAVDRVHQIPNDAVGADRRLVRGELRHPLAEPASRTRFTSAAASSLRRTAAAFASSISCARTSFDVADTTYGSASPCSDRRRPPVQWTTVLSGGIRVAASDCVRLAPKQQTEIALPQEMIDHPGYLGAAASERERVVFGEDTLGEVRRHHRHAQGTRRRCRQFGRGFAPTARLDRRRRLACALCAAARPPAHVFRVAGARVRARWHVGMLRLVDLRPPQRRAEARADRTATPVAQFRECARRHLRDAVRRVDRVGPLGDSAIGVRQCRRATAVRPGCVGAVR